MITVTIETENDIKRVIIIEGNTEKAINDLSSKPARFLQSKNINNAWNNNCTL